MKNIFRLYYRQKLLFWVIENTHFIFPSYVNYVLSVLPDCIRKRESNYIFDSIYVKGTCLNCYSKGLLLFNLSNFWVSTPSLIVWYCKKNQTIKSKNLVFSKAFFMIQFFNFTIITEIWVHHMNALHGCLINVNRFSFNDKFRTIPLNILAQILEIKSNECLFGPCPDTLLNYVMV